MSDLYRDLLHDRTVIIATERNQRPFDTRPSINANPSQSCDQSNSATRHNCPFCCGNEKETPPEILALRPADSIPDSPDWRVRLVPNRYPAVKREIGIPQHDTKTTSALGDHDVLICCPAHRVSAAELNDDEWQDVLFVARQRMNMWRDENRWRWATLFQNVGAAAGASLEHIHCQMLALPTVPATPAQEFESSAAYHFMHNRCYWCDEIASVAASSWSIEKTSVANGVQSRLVIQSDSHVAFCPLASRLPYEVWILPKRHNSHFELSAQEDLADLAKLSRAVLVKLERFMPSVAYNWWLHSAPFDSAMINHYHWHIEVIPRIATTAGFELCSGWHINSVSADQAAKKLREINITSYQ